MEVTLGAKILVTLADASVYMLMIAPVVSVILRDRIKTNTNETGVFSVAVALSMFILFGVWIIEMIRFNNMRLIVSSFALLILSISETIGIFKYSPKQ